MQSWNLWQAIMKNIEIFEKHAAEYDEWFEENEAAYKSKTVALRDSGCGCNGFFLPCAHAALLGRFYRLCGIRLAQDISFVRVCTGLCRRRELDHIDLGSRLSAIG